MKRRRVKDYNAIWRCLKKEARTHGLEMKPEFFMVDFEIAVILAFRQHFTATVKGCLFHFSQSLFKNLTKHHLKPAYLECPKLQVWFKKIFTLALLPLALVEERFISLCDEMMQVLSLDPRIGNNGNNYCEYITATYFEGVFPQSLWNHYLTDSQTTNNYVEGDNFKMNSHCNSSNPNINKGSDMLVQYDAISVNKYNNACKPHAKAPPLDREIRDRNISFRIARQFHRDGEITNEVYIAKILNLYRFEEKKKQKETLEDTDSEDDATESTTHSTTESTKNHQQETLDPLNDTNGAEEENEADVSMLSPVAVSPVVSPKVSCIHCGGLFKKGGINRHIVYCKKKPA